jgi:hypothetical protein
MGPQADAVERRSPSTWAGFFAWAMFGAATAFGSVSFPTLAILLIIVGGSMARFRPALRRSWIGAITGAGALFMYVAYVQRRGPGTVCWHTATASGCDQYLNPWPWLVVGAGLVVTGLVVQARRINSFRPST